MAYTITNNKSLRVIVTIKFVFSSKHNHNQLNIHSIDHGTMAFRICIINISTIKMSYLKILRCIGCQCIGTYNRFVILGYEPRGGGLHMYLNGGGGSHLGPKYVKVLLTPKSTIRISSGKIFFLIGYIEYGP